MRAEQTSMFYSYIVQFSSVPQSCLTLCNPIDCSMPGFLVLHHLLELAQTHHWVADAIQPSRPLSLPSPPAVNLSQHQGLFQWVSSSNQVTKLFLILCLGVIIGHNFSSKEQASFNFMAVVIICSDFGAQENKKSVTVSTVSLFAMNWWDQMPWSSFFLNVEF